MDVKFILGRKEGMTQLFTKDGRMIPVTVVEAGPCFVAQVKTPDTDGYSALQLSFKEKKLQRTSKPLKGHFKKMTQGEGENKKTALTAYQYLREFRVDDASSFNPGDEITADVFTAGEFVNVVGTSKGKGFAGVMKRWNFGGGPQTHGAMCKRRPGSIGMHSDPSRVFKGKKMAGQYGNARNTVKNLQIVRVIPEKNVLLIKGPVPGARNGLLQIRISNTRTPVVMEEAALEKSEE